MKIGGRILRTSLLFTMVMFLLAGAAGAAVPISAPPPAGEINEGTHISIDVQQRSDVERGSADLLKEWSCGIMDNGDGSVYISGTSETYSTVGYLDATIYLQRWNGSTWVDITGRTYSESNDSYVSGSTRISVSRGYYYRARGVHTAQNGENNDGRTSLSGGIMID